MTVSEIVNLTLPEDGVHQNADNIARQDRIRNAETGLGRRCVYPNGVADVAGPLLIEKPFIVPIGHGQTAGGSQIYAIVRRSQPSICRPLRKTASVGPAWMSMRPEATANSRKAAVVDDRDGVADHKRAVIDESSTRSGRQRRRHCHGVY